MSQILGVDPFIQLVGSERKRLSHRLLAAFFSI